MNIKIKKLHKDAVIPTRGSDYAAGYDLVAVDDGVITDMYIEYKTGIAIEPPLGYHVEIYPRSSISKYDLMLANSIGLIDQDYRGEIILRFKALSTEKFYKKGDKIAQLVIKKTEIMSMELVEDISDTNRGSGGFGSTGN